MEVIPIVQPVINWEAYVSGAVSALGRSPTRSLDAAGMRAGSHLSYIQSLGELQHPDTAPALFVKGRESDRAFEHLFAGFLIACSKPTLCEFAKISRVPMIEADHPVDGVAVATASLSVWRTTIIECCHPATSRDLRQLMNKIQHAFSIWGFSSLWQDHARQPMPDGSVALMPRLPLKR